MPGVRVYTTSSSVSYKLIICFVIRLALFYALCSYTAPMISARSPAAIANLLNTAYINSSYILSSRFILLPALKKKASHIPYVLPESFNNSSILRTPCGLLTLLYSVLKI